MTPEEALWTRLRNLAPVNTITGRIFRERQPQSVRYPLVVVSRIDEPKEYHIRGPLNGGRVRIQVDARTQEVGGYDALAAINSLVDAINGDGLGDNASGLSGFKGTVGDVRILACLLLNRPGQQRDPQELQTLTVSLEYSVRYQHVM